MELSSPVTECKGIGTKTAGALARLGIHNVRDLLYHYPRGYEDRTKITPVDELSGEMNQLALVTITAPVRKIRIRGGKVMIQADAADDSGSIQLCFFNQEYMKNVLREGESYYIYGKATGGRFVRDMINPEVQPATTEFSGEILPLYPLTDGVRQSDLRKAIRQALNECLDKITDSLPNSVRMTHGLATAKFAIENIHFPSSEEACAMARKRLIFGEFFLLAAGLKQRKDARVEEAGKKLDTRCVNEFTSKLPFTLTGAQERTLREICTDLASGFVMSRLVQGDVGSGKTAVAAAAAFVAIQNGLQAAVMAPTELLAAQHAKTFSNFLTPFGLNCALLTSSTPATQKKQILEGLGDGSIPFVVGTHALLEERVAFQKLGFVVCDEQHRFGVEQRAKLAAKGESVHTLVMSATPIPRTLALVMYGDLQVSVIDELPPGRKKVDTFAIGEEKREGLYGFLRQKIAEGRQAYIVCPLVEENESLELQSVTEYTKKLREEIFPDLRIALLHGRLKPAEKNEIMQTFARGETDILVSTTVIEVGIDVPNATTIVVENAERFGLSQLHQLRGRVGRGQEKSYCFLLSEGDGDTRKRLKVMTATNDGFKVAQKDTELRGPGELFGTRQSGSITEGVNLMGSDAELLKITHDLARELLSSDSEEGRIVVGLAKARFANKLNEIAIN